MAMLAITAMIGMQMKTSDAPATYATGAVALDAVWAVFRADGWLVRPPETDQDPPGTLVSKDSSAYLAVAKSSSEGRADRVIPLLSQTILEARHHARDRKAQPLAIVHVGNAQPALLQRVGTFMRRYAPDAAVGIVGSDGGRHFIGPDLASLNVTPPRIRRHIVAPTPTAANLFTDLNQWLLKVLLAPEIPQELLTAPRVRCQSISQLANEAGVSLMTASRFITRMREEGFLDSTTTSLLPVRRAELFRRWQSAALHSPAEMPIRFLNRAAGQSQLYETVSNNKGCLALFAAADLLGLGHVVGVPPHVYVRSLPRSEDELWRGLVPARPGDHVDLILRQAAAPQSMLRGAVQRDGLMATDVLQIWLDVSAHPSRGQEQADHLRHTVLHDGFAGPA